MQREVRNYEREGKSAFEKYKEREGESEWNCEEIMQWIDEASEDFFEKNNFSTFLRRAVYALFSDYG